MKSYACYPRTKAYPSTAGFVAPNFPKHQFRSHPSTGLNLPAANILRKEGAFTIELAVPGLTRDQIKIEMEQGQMIVSAVKAETEQKTNYLRNEFDYKGFKRVFRLHKNANTEAINATFNQGILTIVIPDREPETRKIEIL